MQAQLLLLETDLQQFDHKKMKSVALWLPEKPNQDLQLHLALLTHRRILWISYEKAGVIF